VTAVAVLVVDMAAAGLPRIQTKFRVASSPLSLARRENHQQEAAHSYD